MTEDISLSQNIQFTPNGSFYSVNDQSNTTNNESTPITNTSGDSCIFYTPNSSLNSDLKLTPPPPTIPKELADHTPMGLETPSHIREEKNLSLKVEGSSLIPKFTSTPLQPTKKPKRRYI